jgi:hypothetical protein
MGALTIAIFGKPPIRYDQQPHRRHIGRAPTPARYLAVTQPSHTCGAHPSASTYSRLRHVDAAYFAAQFTVIESVLPARQTSWRSTTSQRL